MFLNWKGIKAQRHAVKQAEHIVLPELSAEEKERIDVEYVCAHYTMMGLSFFIKLRNGKVIQRKIQPTPAAIAELFSSIGG